MGEIVELKPAHLAENHEFVSDCCRFQEGILTEANMKRKYGFADNVWTDLGSNEKLLAAVEEEKIRRMRTGQQKRERAQQLVVKAPDVLNALMTDVTQNARHRIDSAKLLNDFSANGPGQSAPASDRFSIVINLGADLEGRPIVEKYDRSKKVDVNDIDPHHIDDTPHGPWPIITANRRKDDGSGEPL